MNNKIARFVTRGTPEGKVDLVLGMAFKSQEELKPNRVYELREVVGQVILVDIGECAIGDCPPTERNMEYVPHWGYSVNTIIEEMGKHMILTREEYEAVLKNELR